MVMHEDFKNIDDMIKELDETAGKNNDSPISDVAPSAGDLDRDVYKEQFIRLSADFTNYKKRVEKERADWIISAQGVVLEKLLPFLDDLHRAFESSEKMLQPEMMGWLDGFRLMEKNLNKTLQGLGVEEIATNGQFDPEFHEALMRVACPEGKQSGDIVQVFSKGYTMKGKVLKHAQVSVAQ